MLNPLKYALSTLPSTIELALGKIAVREFMLRYSLIELEQNAMLEAKHRNTCRFELSCSSDLRLKLESKREGGFDVARYSIFNTTNVHVSGVSCINDYHKLIRRDIKTIVEINKLYTHLYTFELAWKNITLTYGMK